MSGYVGPTRIFAQSRKSLVGTCARCEGEEMHHANPEEHQAERGCVETLYTNYGKVRLHQEKRDPAEAPHGDFLQGSAG